MQRQNTPSPAKLTLESNPATPSNNNAMATSPVPLDGEEYAFDTARPFKGVVVCCTSIPTELRADIAAKTTELGGLHKYDLTPDCTHLIIGDYNTAKYRHVAKERPDVKVMAAGWVEAVRNLWVQDAEIDFVALEKEWQLRTFETGGGEPTADGSVHPRRRLLCCMTGFEDPDERQHIIDMIEGNGGVYTGDLTKRATHLVVYKPEGRKYQAAINWGILTVSAEWVNDSVERGLILDEKLYDPVLPREERGRGAWNKQKAQRLASLGKRLRDNAAPQDEGKRKLRKVASAKLNSQRDNLWGDILGKPQASPPPTVPAPPAIPTNPPAVPPAQATQPSGAKSWDTQGSRLSSFGVPEDGAVFASCCFYVHGFSTQKTEILVSTVASLGGLVCHSLDEVVSTSGAQLAHRFLIVPQTSAPETHPRLSDNVHIITEFYIERCLHKKYFFDPSQHVIGRPFPLFPIPQFEELVISTAGFTGVDLNQVDKSIRQLGAKYEERFTANVSLLVCPTLTAVRKQKLELALAWKVPVVSADWLWECISAGFRVPIKRFLFPELKQNLSGPKALTQSKEKGMEKEKTKDMAKVKQNPATGRDIDRDLLPQPASKSATKPRQRQILDESAFVTAREGASEPSHLCKVHPATEHDSNVTTATHFETAPTHAFATSEAAIRFGTGPPPSEAPLSEASPNALNTNARSPQKQDGPLPRKSMTRITSEVADSEATDGDLGQTHDIPVREEEDKTANHAEQQQGEEQESPGPEAEQKRVEAEKAAERLAISSKLVSSLLDSTTSKLTNTVSAAGGAAAATTATTVGAGAAAASESGLDAAVGASGSSRGGAGLGGGDDAAGRPKRRKRNILGRAISNVSAASSTSNGGGDSASAPAVAVAGAPAGAAGASFTAAVTAAGTNTANTRVGAAVQGGNAPPAATQLEYEDPGAQRYKDELMSKMTGGFGATGSSSRRAGGGAAPTPAPPRQEKLTLAGMGGYDLRQQGQGQGQGRYEVGGGERRTRRR